MKNPALFSSDCVDHVITTAPVSLSRTGRKCESSTGNAPPARKPGVPHIVRSTVVALRTDMRHLCETRIRCEHPIIHHRAIFRFRRTPSDLDVSTDNRTPSAFFVHRQCPSGGTVSTEVTDCIGRPDAFGFRFPLIGLPSCLRSICFTSGVASSVRVPVVRA